MIRTIIIIVIIIVAATTKITIPNSISYRSSSANNSNHNNSSRVSIPTLEGKLVTSMRLIIINIIIIIIRSFCTGKL